MNEWISVEDKMPPDGQYVLVYYGDNLDDVKPAIEIDYATTGMVDYCDGTPERMVSNWTYKSYRCQEIQPTHWMTLPEPPRT